MKVLTSAEYAAKRGIECPVCHCTSGVFGNGIEIDRGVATQEVECEACGTSWIDTYVLDGYVDLVKPGK